MDEPPVAGVLYDSRNKVIGIVYGDDSPITAVTDCNYYDGFCVISYYPEPPSGWMDKLRRHLFPAATRVAVVQTGPEGALNEEWCGALARELTRHLGFGVVHHVDVTYDQGQTWLAVMEFNSKAYGPRMEERIRTAVDWILENYDAAR